MPELVFLGTGEAFDPLLPNTSLLYRGERSILFDCGYSVPQALWRVSQDPDMLDAVVISHTHADHCFGLPALCVWMKHNGRTRPLQVLGGPGIRDSIVRLLELGYPRACAPGRCFPIEPRELEPEQKLELGAVSLRAAPSSHSLENFAVRLEEGDSVLCYSGDGAPTAATERLYRSASVLVHECYSLSEATPGHATLRDVTRAAEAAGVGRLYLVHVARAERALVERELAISTEHKTVLLPRPGDRVAL